MAIRSCPFTENLLLQLFLSVAEQVTSTNATNYVNITKSNRIHSNLLLILIHMYQMLHCRMIVTIGNTLILLLLLQQLQQQQHQVGATESVRVVFNNGEEASSDTFCSNEDYYIISQAMEYISSSNNNNRNVRYRRRRRRRHLRQSYEDDITATTDFQLFLQNKATKRTKATLEHSRPQQQQQQQQQYHHHHTNETKLSTSRMERTYSAKCRDLCSGYRTGTCRATNCAGYRRHNRRRTTTTATAMVRNRVASTGSRSQSDTEKEEEEQVRYLQEEEQSSWECHHLMEYTNFVLNEMIAGQYVSSTCSAFLMEDRRSVDCFDNTMFGEIDQVYVTYSNANAPEERITSELPIDGESQLNICKNVVDDTNTPIRLEAIGNECVYNIDFTIILTESEVYHEYHMTTRPYEAYVPDIQQQPGHYHVLVTPNGNDIMTKIYSFDIVDC